MGSDRIYHAHDTSDPSTIFFFFLAEWLIYLGKKDRLGPRPSPSSAKKTEEEKMEMGLEEFQKSAQLARY